MRRLLSLGLVLLSLVVFDSSAAADSTPPVTQASLEGTLGANDWYVSGVDLSLVASDLESGVASLNYRLDEGDWQHEEFLETLNRVQNPSFEDGTFGRIDKWSHPYYPLWRAFFWHSYQHKFGSRSAAALLLMPGTYYWTNRADYAVVEPGKIYTAAVWLRSFFLYGDGAYLSVWAKKSGPDELLVESDRVSGTVDWTRLSFTFSPPAGSEGVYFRLNVTGGYGWVFWDGVSLIEEGETGVSFIVGSSGSHRLEYYSVDHAGNEEEQKDTSFKIDTASPSNWRDFEAIPTVNDHTFECRITVDDSVSGLDISTARYQYTWDGGTTWSGWLSDLSVEPSNDGAKTVTLVTPDVDFHDSNWSRGKLIRFKIGDLAGLEGVSPDQALSGAWFQSRGGDIYSGGNISANTLGPEDNARGLILTVGATIANFTSSRGWTLPSYTALNRTAYVSYQTAYPPASNLPDGRLPLSSGRYFAGDGDFVIDNQTIPNEPGGDLASQKNLAVVVYVGGDLIIRTDLSVDPTSIFLFIVRGNVAVAKSVERIDASFLADGHFDSSYDGSPPQKQLTINGLVVAKELLLRRSLPSDDNGTIPAEIFTYPAQIIKLAPYLGEGEMRWRELH